MTKASLHWGLSVCLPCTGGFLFTMSASEGEGNAAYGILPWKLSSLFAELVSTVDVLQPPNGGQEAIAGSGSSHNHKGTVPHERRQGANQLVSAVFALIAVIMMLVAAVV